MSYDLFTGEARASICRYFAESSLDPLRLIDERAPEETDRSGYAYRFVTPGGAGVTDAHVWMNLVAELIKWPGGIGTPTYNAILDTVCTEEFVRWKGPREKAPSACFIEPFFTGLGRELLCEHHGIQYRGPQSESGPRDPDLWAEFLLQVRRARRKNNASALGAFLIGPHAMLATKATNTNA